MVPRGTLASRRQPRTRPAPSDGPITPKGERGTGDTQRPKRPPLVAEPRRRRLPTECACRDESASCRRADGSLGIAAIGSVGAHKTSVARCLSLGPRDQARQLSPGASASNNRNTRSAQSGAHTATIRRSASLRVCGEPTRRFSRALGARAAELRSRISQAIGDRRRAQGAPACRG